MLKIPDILVTNYPQVQLPKSSPSKQVKEDDKKSQSPSEKSRNRVR